ncbi:M23 family metallopeptidase [Chelatococcus sp. SYSU_G07232]|uniref:M23 family metallopeptidase n=1 Tax=Chelatococcus albus TaxID=3047466 RepID=A0ABT7AJP2_9HYPH|nr:M23 family metallopeptidase [Chelatococcus sp. SYSU_G07232]MDJ1159584.1 M23 family metallopeptidase [Chelatococcus sp. SYSU_G07232]
MSERPTVSTPRSSLGRPERSPRSSPAVDLGHEPPLDPVGLSTPQGDRRAVSLRWLAGSVLTGVSGAALIGAAIYVSLQGETTFAELPEPATLPAGRQAGTTEVAGTASKSDKLVKTQTVSAAKQSFKAPVTIRVADREVIKVKPFVRLATNLSLTTGTYATDIPPFNPLKLFAEGSDAPERYADAPTETTDADVSVVKRDLHASEIDDSSPTLSDEEVEAQMAEERRLAAEAGKRPVLPLPPQLMLSRTLRQPDAIAGLQGYANPVDTPFSGLEVRVVPENVTVLAKKDAAGKDPLVEERIVVLKKGETLEQMLKANGATPEQIRSILAAIADRLKLSAVGEGQQVKLLIAPGPRNGDARQIMRVTLLDEQSIQAMAAVNDRGAFVPVFLPQDEVVARGPGDAEEEEEDEEDEEGGSGARLYASLYETALKNEIPRHIADEMVRIFASDVDFQRRVTGGDSLEIFYSEDEEGDGARAEILYASLSVGGETRRVYRYQSPDDNTIDYFDEEGRSLKKFLMRKPITDAIMRSGFGYRRHPVLGYSKMHTGVDWANKIGTPILAAGDGVVIKAGWESGYGKHTQIQHANGYVTTYSHQSAFARGIAPGTKVRQGQVIGYLGSTGLSTGPHLHYEVLVNGHFVNPMKIKVPRGRELDGRALAEFRRQRDQVNDLVAKAATSTVVAQQGR